MWPDDSERPRVKESRCTAGRVVRAEDLLVRAALTTEQRRGQTKRKLATRGTNEGRIQKLLQLESCPYCQQVGVCTTVPLASAHAAAKTYWAMTDQERAIILYNMYSEAAGRDEKTGKCQCRRVTYSLGSCRVCFDMFCGIVGAGKKTVRSFMAGTWSPKLAHSREKSASHFVDFFFMSLYQSAAEPLPHLPAGVIRKKKDPDFDHPEIPAFNAGDELNPGEASMNIG